MLTYMNKIIDMQKEEPFTYYWRTFDETFRRFKAGCQGAPWHIIHPNVAGDARSEYIRNAPQNSQIRIVEEGASQEGVKDKAEGEVEGCLLMYQNLIPCVDILMMVIVRM